MYFSGQGKVFIAERDGSGNAGVFRHVGNCPELNIQLSTDTTEHKESVSGLRVVDYRLIRQNKAEISFTLEEFSKENLALALYGASAVIAGASVTNEAFPNPVAVGDYVRTKYGKLSAISVSDNLAAALTVGTHYEMASVNHGMVKILNLAAFTQPLKINYTYASQVNLLMFTQAPTEKWIRFEGLNTANASAPLLIETYRCLLDPISDFAVLNDDLAKFALKGSVLYDAAKASDSVLGPFGRIDFLSPTA